MRQMLTRSLRILTMASAVSLASDRKAWATEMNLLRNGSLDVWESQTTPNDWSQPELTPGAQIFRETRDVHTQGGSAVKFVNRSSRDSSSIAKRGVNIEANTTYQLSGYFKAENVKPGTRILCAWFRSENGEVISKAIKAPKSDFGWTRLAVSFTAPGDMKGYIKLMLYRSPGTLYVDDVSLREKEAADVQAKETEVVSMAKATMPLLAEFIERAQHVKYLYKVDAGERITTELTMVAGKPNKITIRTLLYKSIGTVYVNGKYLGCFGGEAHLPYDNGEAEYSYLVTPETSRNKVEIEAGYPAKWIRRGAKEIEKDYMGRIYVLDIRTEVAEASKLMRPLSRRLTTNFVRVSPNRRYFQLDNGESFYPIGTSIAFVFVPKLDARNGWYNWGSPFGNSAKDLLKLLARHGVNFVRLRLESEFEPQPPHNYAEQSLQKLDEMIDTCRDLGIYVDLSIGGRVIPRPYAKLLKQCSPPARQFYLTENRKRRELLLNRARFLARRYKSEKTIMSYTLAYEIWYMEGEDRKRWVEDFVNTLATPIKEEDENHLVTVDVGVRPWSANLVFRGLFKCPNLDYLSAHLYNETGWTYKEKVDFFQRMVEEAEKPIIEGEGDVYLEPRHFWEDAWAVVFGGGSGFRPWYGPAFCLSESHVRLLGSVARITREVNWARLEPVIKPRLSPQHDKIKGNCNLRYIGDRRGREFLIWIQTHPRKDVSLEIAGLNGNYHVKWWDPWSGNLLVAHTVTANGNLAIKCREKGQKNRLIVHIRKMGDRMGR